MDAEVTIKGRIEFGRVDAYGTVIRPDAKLSIPRHQEISPEARVHVLADGLEEFITRMEQRAEKLMRLERYLVFGGARVSANDDRQGGASDFVGVFETRALAREAVEDLRWWQIARLDVDAGMLEVVASSG
jgi:hypothetical protein